MEEIYQFDQARYDAFCAKMAAKEQAWRDEVTDIHGARKVLDEYVHQLNARFLPGGVFDTSSIPSGEEFVELVCGGEFFGQIPCRCFTPHVAVRVFIDTVERYIALRPVKYGIARNQTIFWRVYPILMSCDTDEWSRYDEGVGRVVTRRETLFNVRARLLIL